jgi:hypothetical protein
MPGAKHLELLSILDEIWIMGFEVQPLPLSYQKSVGYIVGEERVARKTNLCNRSRMGTWLKTILAMFRGMVCTHLIACGVIYWVLQSG